MLKSRTPLVVAIVFALLAGVVAFLAVQRRGIEISQRWEPVPVLVARDRLASGTELGPDNLQRGLMPRALITKSVVTLEDHQRVSVFGRKLALPMEPGDVLLYSHVLTKTGEQHLAEAVQQKGRAVSIRVSPESAVHHWVEPADRVDIVGVFRDPKSGELVSMTMLQNVIVLATGRIGGQTNRRLLSETEQGYDTVTLHVLPEAAEMLVLAQDLGTLYLTLRNPEDTEINDLGSSKTTMQTLITGERSKRLSTTQSKIFKVEIIRGRRSETQMIP
jgi:pilus assembly protein CpaB